MMDGDGGKYSHQRVPVTSTGRREARYILGTYILRIYKSTGSTIDERSQCKNKNMNYENYLSRISMHGAPISIAPIPEICLLCIEAK